MKSIVVTAMLMPALLGLGACSQHSASYRDAGTAPDQAAATPAYTEVQQALPECKAGQPTFECDRRAILAMLGEYKVSFRFDETAVLAADYQRKPEQRSGGFETVVLIEDQGERIDLQHILVVGDGMVVKHWRQTWVYEADSIWEFKGDQRFVPKQRDAATLPGSWTQFVYEVSDAPRYAGSGRWNHKYGVSTWTSDRTWRPLPRREYTKRSDYQLLNVENRHTITPSGWTHEQDNSKVRRAADGSDQVLVREFGFNDYRRIQGHDFSPGYEYWGKTGDFWAEVRQRWALLLGSPAGLQLDYPTDDEDFIGSMFEAAEHYAKDADLGAARQRIEALFAARVHPGDAAPKPLAGR